MPEGGSDLVSPIGRNRGKNRTNQIGRFQQQQKLFFFFFPKMNLFLNKRVHTKETTFEKSLCHDPVWR
jgi:hypothetical protein